VRCPARDFPISLRWGQAGPRCRVGMFITGMALKPAPRREMFSTLPHLPQGHPRSYGRCSSPACITKLNSQSWLGAALWEDSVARVGLNEIRPEVSKTQPGLMESCEDQDAPGLA